MFKVIFGIVLFRIKCDRIEGAGPASTSIFTYVSTTEEFVNGQIFHSLSCNICECCMVFRAVASMRQDEAVASS